MGKTSAGTSFSRWVFAGVYAQGAEAEAKRVVVSHTTVANAYSECFANGWAWWLIGRWRLAIISALKEELGIRVEERKALIDTLVVEHAERTPTDN